MKFSMTMAEFLELAKHISLRWQAPRATSPVDYLPIEGTLAMHPRHAEYNQRMLSPKARWVG